MIWLLLTAAEVGSESDKPPVAAESAAMMQAVEQFKVCTADAARRFALGTNEPAETVVDASLGNCPDEDRALRIAAVGFFGATHRQNLQTFLDSWRRTLLASILRFRTHPPKTP